MKIFKNRGDIYFSKANKEKSNEQKILLTALVLIVVVTVIFVSIMCIKYDFSAKNFFAPETIVTTASDAEDSVADLPEVSGKTNYISMVYEDDTLLFVIVTQSDMDNKAFKTAVLKGNTEFDGNTLSAVYSSSGEQNVKTAVESALGCEIDYYISFEKSDFQDFFDALGEITFPVASTIKYRGEGDNPYTLKINAGEQSVNGQTFVNLIRYYIEEENNTSSADELALTALTQQLNSENMENSDDLFKTFSSLANTSITIRDYSLASNNLTVITNDLTSMSVYSAKAEYDGNTITEDSLKTVKGYFVK